MMRAAVLFSVVAAVCGCGRTPFQTVYLKGPPQRVAVTKHAEPAVVAYRVTRAGSTLRLTLRSRTPVRLRRQVVKSTYLIEVRGQARWELIEIPLGLFILPIVPMLYGMPNPTIDGPDMKARLHENMYLLFADPRTTLIGATAEGRLSIEDAFPSAPESRRYRVSLPLREQTVHYQVISAERAAIAAGEATTSRFGEIAIPDVPDDAVAVEVTHGGATRLIVIE